MYLTVDLFVSLWLIDASQIPLVSCSSYKRYILFIEHYYLIPGWYSGNILQDNFWSYKIAINYCSYVYAFYAIKTYQQRSERFSLGTIKAMFELLHFWCL